MGLLVVLACCALHAQSAESYGIVESRDVMIPMRDGVKLAADVYRPARDGQAVEGKFPVLLMRTPYNKERASASATAFVPHGYVRGAAGRARPVQVRRALVAARRRSGGWIRYGEVDRGAAVVRRWHRDDLAHPMQGRRNMRWRSRTRRI